MSKLSKIDIFFILGLTCLCYLTFFHHLGEFSIRLWDEGRNAVNAVEMISNNKWLVTHFNWSPDMWNVKPPLHIWIVALFFKIFGISELSLRLPSAISATVVVLGIYLVGKYILKNRWIGVLGALILLSSMGFPEIHIGRTGDYDALLTVWVFGAIIFSFCYLENLQKKNLYLAGLFWFLAVMTKGVAGLMMLPALFLYSLVKGKLAKVLGDKYFWLTLLFMILGVNAYYFGREHFNPGYLKAVFDEEFIGRYQRDVGSGGANFWYYWKLMASFRFQKWIYFVPVSIFGYFLTKEKNIKNWILLTYLAVVSYFVIISGSETKQYWYDAQLYPLASLLAASLIVLVLRKIHWVGRWIPIIILMFYMQRYIRTNLAYIHRPDLDKDNSCLKYGYLFRDKSIDKSGFSVVHGDNTCFALHFYVDQNKLVRKEMDSVVRGDKILTCDNGTLESINKVYKSKNIFSSQNGCVGLEVE